MKRFFAFFRRRRLKRLSPSMTRPRSGEVTAFHRCLAVHLFYARGRSALEL